MRPSPVPPSFTDVRQELIDQIAANLENLGQVAKPRFENLMRELKRALPDREWMLIVISTLTQG